MRAASKSPARCAARLAAAVVLAALAVLGRTGAAALADSPPPAAKGAVGWDAYRRLDLLPQLTTGVETRQFSSFDRTGGNDDGFGGTYSCLRHSADGCVIAEAEGPGEIDSIWFTANFADPGNVAVLGDITIELDGRKVLDASLQDVVDGRLGAPFVFPLVADREQSSGGSYIKVPMPFRRSMRITTEQTAQYHHVGYRRFADADGVRTFDASDPARDVIARLRAAGERDPKPRAPRSRTERATFSLPPGGSRTLARLDGPGTISEVAVRVPQLVGADFGPLISDDGRGFRDGSSTFTARIDPGNDGVRLTRRIDTYWANSQEAAVFVDGEEAGRWPTVPTTLASRWVDVSLDLPAALTRGKSRIEVRTESLPTLWGAVQEFTYWVDSRVGEGYARTDELDVGLDSTADEAAHGYRIDHQAWQGTTRTRYAPRGDRDTIAASDAVLEGARLRISFDGEKTVDAPLGEFFGSGLGETRVRSLMFAMETADDGWYRAWWPMPFRSRATVELYNGSSHAITAAESRVTAARSSAAARGLSRHGDLGYFHASARRGAVEPGRDWAFLDARGHGKFVGVAQTMRGRPADSLTQRGYLEGDERVYVDGSRSPQLHGTGTEDFYEGAWYFSYGTFSNPVNGSTAFEVQELGCAHVCDAAYRLMLGDAVPFDSSLRFGIEHGLSDEWPADYGSTAFWYGRTEPASTTTDTLDVGDPASEGAHGYSADPAGERTVLTAVFEGDDDDVQVTDDGRATKAPIAFTLALDPRNRGVVLRRMSDQQQDHQAARVLVDGHPAGVWLEPLGNPHERWLEDSFPLPAELTSKRRRVRITLVPLDDAPPWHAARYRALDHIAR